MNNKFKIVVALYNVEKYIGTTIKSVLGQTYSDYECILINDKSTDKSLDICKELVEKNPKFKIVDNQNKKCSLENIYDTIHAHTDGEDIVVILDGDDFLASRTTLEELNTVYSKEDCWLTYGSYINLSNRLRGKFAKQIPYNIIENNQFRDYEWCTSHLRSFKSFLFKEIKKESLCDTEGLFYTFAGDLAIMFPLLELARQKSTYIDKILYVWNDLNILNEHKRDNTKQMLIEKAIRGRKKYARYNK
tara:strand:- start:590 stop:1330 length:741 start_codon:yes stop_codon:yes gene_type:complete